MITPNEEVATKTVSLDPLLAIPLEKLRDENIDNENPDDVILANPQWGSVSMLANAASFDTVVSSVVAKAYSNQFWNIERNGSFSLTNGGGTLQETFEQMFGIIDEDGKKKDDDALDDYADAVAEQREEVRRQQEEWNQSKHSFADVELTGEEWGELSDALSKDTKFRRDMIDRLMKEKRLSQKDAEAAVDKAARISKLMNIPESQRTEAEKAELQTYREQNDPNTNTVLDWSEKARDNGFKRLSSETGVAGGRNLSVASRDDVLAAAPNPSSLSVSLSPERDSAFFSAPELTVEHRKAVAATEPLDALKAPVKIASADAKPAPVPTADMGGLSV